MQQESIDDVTVPLPIHGGGRKAGGRSRFVAEPLAGKEGTHDHSAAYRTARLGADERRDPEPLVGERGRLPDLSAQLPGFQQRRHGRPQGHHLPSGLSGRPGRGRAVAVAGVQIPAGRQRLRHRRLSGHRPHVRYARRHGRAAGRGPQARPEGHHGSGGQPHLRRARLVPGLARQERPARRLVHLASRARGPRARHPRCRAEPLGLLLRRLRLAV